MSKLVISPIGLFEIREKMVVRTRSERLDIALRAAGQNFFLHPLREHFAKGNDSLCPLSFYAGLFTVQKLYAGAIPFFAGFSQGDERVLAE